MDNGMDNKKMVIGSRINSALAYSNKKQKDLAAHLGVPDNTISYFCSGKRVPNAEQIIKISKFLKVSSDYLLGLNENPTTDKDITFICDKTGLDEKAVKKLILDIEIKRAIDRKVGYNVKENDIFSNIQSWIISKGYLSRMVCILAALNNMSKKLTDIDSLSYKKLHELYEMTEIDFIDIGDNDVSIENNRTNEKNDTSGNFLNDFIELETNCDTKRYNLTKIIEEMANHFDQREQVKDNGKHNSPKE